MPTPAQIYEREQLKIDESIRYKPYRDTEGKLTIGVGRNLDDVGLHDNEIWLMLDNDIQVATQTAERYLGVDVFNNLSTDRQGVLINMAFNLGFTRLSGFKNLRAAILAGNYSKAADEMLNSKWASQVGARAQRLAKRMKG